MESGIGNRESSEDGQWSIPVSEETISKAREGNWEVVLTPLRAVPKSWFGDLQGKNVLCLASGGGQQAPVLAAAGAKVVSFDLSDVQLEKDRMVAEREKLDLACIRGDMADLSGFASESFDLIFHAVSNVFVPNVEIVWKECYRVLKPGGDLLAGFMNPSFFLFDHEESERTGRIEVKYKLPYAEPTSLNEAGLQELEESGRAFEFGHTLESQIGGQLNAGFMISGIYEDYWTDEIPLNSFSPSYIATKSTKTRP
ncbi:class I SAM-dependent methyltransferase [Neptuniibacter pectenicola]|uniref:class I SAM-dependent methyltransferase n=1 Tax=Neptuniibacter pectenicola TaxID=1806669 RepID=UPI0030EC0F86